MNFNNILFTVGVLFLSNFIPGNIGVHTFVKSAHAQTCTLPVAPQNVLVEFPSCVGTTCNWTQAKCSWGAVTGATKYQLVITEVETGTVVKNEQPDAATTNVIFSVNQNKTYKCDVSAINACGTGTAGTSSLYCKVDVAVTTPIPTTAASAPQPTVPPSIPEPGNMTMSIILVIASVSFVILGLGILIFI